MFAGFRVTSIAIAAAFAVLLAWNVWETRKVLALEKRQLVSVSLQSLITDFVTSESRRGATPEETAAKTRAYLAAVQSTIARLGANGTPVLLSEAVVGNSVPDATATIRAAVLKAMGGAVAGPTAALVPPGPAAPALPNQMLVPQTPSSSLAAPLPTAAEPPASSASAATTSLQGPADGQQ